VRAFLQLDAVRIQLDVADDMSITGIVNAVSQWQKSPERITRWVAFMDRIRIARESGLGSMAESVLDGSLSEASLLPTFERSYLEAMRSVIFASNPEIKRFDGEVHSRLVESFRKLDLERMRLARDPAGHWALPRSRSRSVRRSKTNSKSCGANIRTQRSSSAAGPANPSS
jgi:hypothetical protein